MSNINPIRSTLSGFRVYESGVDDMLGVANVDLPEISFGTEEISGAGVLGKVDMPDPANIENMSLTINWNMENPKAVSLIAPGVHEVEFRGAMSVYDAGTGASKHEQIKVVTRLIAVKKAGGKLESGAKMDPSNEFTVLYLKEFVAGKEVLEIDKLNAVFKVNGTDYLSEYRTALGL